MVKKLLTLLLALTVGSGVFAVWIWSYAVNPGPNGIQANAPEQDRSAPIGERLVFIPRGTGGLAIQEILAKEGVIEDDLRFRLLARIIGLSQRLQAGEYSFAPGVTPIQVLRKLEAGDIVRWPITIPEGSTIKEIAEILAGQAWVEREQFLALASDQELIRSLGLAIPHLEGYLFPDTYHLVRGQTAGEIIQMMIGRLRQVLAEFCGPEAGGPLRWETGCGGILGQDKNFSLHELLTLASIIEKETGREEERPLVACVFHNRLRKGMRLQSDPTVIYGLPAFNGNLTRRDLRSDSPYNTYKIKGLPPTPIANPGRASIAAALHPARESYLFFVSKNDGSHHFSDKLQEHNRAVGEFQKKRRNKKNTSRNLDKDRNRR